MMPNSEGIYILTNQCISFIFKNLLTVYLYPKFSLTFYKLEVTWLKPPNIMLNVRGCAQCFLGCSKTKFYVKMFYTDQQRKQSTK